MKTIAIIGTFDTKGTELDFIRKLVQEQGLNTLCIHTGAFEPLFTPEVSNTEVAAAVNVSIEEIREKKDRAFATDVMSRGAEKLVPELFTQGRFDGIISIGGSGGTSMATPAMRALPVGVPKVMVSTMASGNVAQYVGTSDIVMFPSVVDAEGLNAISMEIFSNAVNAVVGMVKNKKPIEHVNKPLIAATMFGVTTPCIKTAKSYLEEQGYEVLVFHATGTGGKTMEALVRGGFIKGVLDITTTEWCDELFGGVLSAGPHRLEAAGQCGVPQVVSVGALDMVNFGPIDTVPEKYCGRNLYKHNPTVTLMRTTVEENVKLGEVIADKLNSAKAPTVLMLPLRGVSAIDGDGQPFDGPEEDKALFDTLRKNIGKNVELIEVDANVNDDEFSLAAAKKLVSLMQS